ncbi:MAG: hypothetical protein QOH25_1231 [Acidobacteriota bacterium]|nr:hypothetical protein [Acidobacteriota bacterium]
MNGQAHVSPDVRLESNQCGIETLLAGQSQTCFVQRLNRTNVELKPFLANTFDLFGR